MTLKRVTFTCPYYVNPGETKRDTIPAGTIVEIIGTSGDWSQISGQDPNPWKGKWVRTFYLEPYAEDTEPIPDPEPPPSEPEPYLIVEKPDGARFAYVLAPDGYSPTLLQRAGAWIKRILGA